MKRKIVFVLSLVFVFSFLFVTQLQRPLFAEECPLSCPMTGPLTSPSLTPTTSVTTTPTMTPTGTLTPTMSPTPTPDPAHAATVSGRVTYRYVGFFRHGKHRQKPAKDVKIVAINIMTGKSFTTQTDNDGKYSLKVEKGRYAVHAESEGKFFSPPVRFVHTKRHGESNDTNFQGFLMKWRD